MANVDAAFKSVDRNKPCFLIWRIENMNVVAVPKPEYGKFFKGDSYIVLSISEKKGAMEAHIHFWLGKETTQDEAGVAAFKSVELDDFLGGYPIQHREVQECESPKFLSYFKNGIKYNNGGVKSGFNHVDTTFKPRLLQIKGKHHVRVQEVDIDWSSFNSGDVFMLDLGNMIYVWMGKESSRTERFKGLEQARAYRDDRAKVNIVDVEEGNEDNMTPSEKDLWNKYLPLDQKKVKTKEEGGADEEASVKLAGLKLYRCTEDDGTLKVSEVKSGPLVKSDLESGDSYIIQNGNQAIWVWIGKQSSKKEKSEAMRNGLGFIKKKNLPTTVSVTRVVESGEPPDFICLFKRWPKPVAKGKVYNNNRIAKTVQTKFDASTLHSNRALAAETKMVDDGTGVTKIWRVKDFDIVPIEKKFIGEFYGGDCYVIKYTYIVNGKENYIIYYWLGAKATSDEKGTAALKAVEMDDELNGAAVQVRVVMGKEPQHFMSMFDGKMIIFEGGHASGYKKTDGSSEESDKGPGDTYMLQVRGTNVLNTKSIQVPMEASSLNSNDVFVVFTKSSVFLWFGKGSTGDEREAARTVAKKSIREPVIVLEGQETKMFWDAIGGKGEYHSDKRLQEETSDNPPRLFQISNASGRFTCDEIPDFIQEDLVSDDCMMLDAGSEVFVWIGNNARPEEKKEAERLAFEYISTDPADRDHDTPILRVKEGFEPATFTGFFGIWDYELFKKRKSYEEYGKELSAENNEVVLVQEPSSNGGDSFDSLPKLKLEDLQKPAEELPENINAAMKEMYLSSDDFQQIFGMSYTDFLSLPAWKQQAMKKKAGLF